METKNNIGAELAIRLNEVFLNGKWIANTNFKAQIDDLNWSQATQKIGNLNSIAALTFHVNYYLAGLIKSFETGKLEISDKFSFDLPPIQSEAEWQLLKDEFLTNAQLFANCVQKMQNDLFIQDFIDKKYGTYLRNIEAVIEHSYYHLGQVSLLKKMILV